MTGTFTVDRRHDGEMFEVRWGAESDDATVAYVEVRPYGSTGPYFEPASCAFDRDEVEALWLEAEEVACPTS